MRSMRYFRRSVPRTPFISGDPAISLIPPSSVCYLTIAIFKPTFWQISDITLWYYFREMRQRMRTSGLVSIDLPLFLEPYSEIVSCVTKLSIPGMID